MALTPADLDEIRALIREELASAGIAPKPAPPKPSDSIYIDDRVVQYIGKLLAATRTSTRIRRGAPDELSAKLVAAAKAHAKQATRSFVTPADVKATIAEGLRGAILWNDDVPPRDIDALIRALIDNVEVP